MAFDFKSFFRGLVGDAKTEVKKTAQAAGAAAAAKTETVSAPSLPKNVAEMTAMSEFDRKDPYKVAFFTIAALCRFPESRDDCYAMINDLKGPEPITVRDKDFIRDRFMDGKDYVPRSYFVGATPANDYTPSTPYKVVIKEQSNSRENEGYIRLFAVSGGADSPRQITLRQKKSTGEWFLNQFEFLLAGIRIPQSQDKWS